MMANRKMYDGVTNDWPHIGPSEPLKCDRYYTDNSNHTHFIYGGYEGIPENLLINFAIWLVLLVAFSILRKKAWNYGRLALVTRNESKWTTLFYSNSSSRLASVDSRESLDAQLNEKDRGICSWLTTFCIVKDSNILEKCGPDAVQYLSFQRYLMLYMSIITVLSIGVVLPINFQGKLEGDKETFGHTTMKNLLPNSPLLWVHATFAVLFLVILVVLMRHFSISLHDVEEEHVTRTLLITNIPEQVCSKDLLQQHFIEAYPEATLIAVNIAHDISRLSVLDKKRQTAMDGRLNSETIYQQTGQRPTIYPYHFGQFCCCCHSCGCRQVDAIEFYGEKERKYEQRCETEKKNTLKSKLGIAFVTFSESMHAAKVRADFKASCNGEHNPSISSVSKLLKVTNWEVHYGPLPSSIYWENLAMSPATWWAKAMCLNFSVCILLFFLTTPSMILNLLNQTSYIKAVTYIHSNVLVQFLPTLILLAVSTALPNIVYYSDQLIGHWTRTAEHHIVMRKTFIFLLLMVLILPSLGLTSAKAFLEWFIAQNTDIYRFRWQCIFIPDNGAFFVNYVITSALTGTAIELMRIPELLVYGFKLAYARSAAEKSSVSKAVMWDFQYGIQYAWMLVVFAVVMAYSIPCPLITPFGLLYLLMKHLVDRYNIYFVYKPSKIDQKIHSSAINFVIVSVILLQFCVLFFTFLRTETLQPVSVFSLIAMFLTLLVFSGHVCFNWFKVCCQAPYVHLSSDRHTISMADAQEIYVPDILLADDTRSKKSHAPSAERPGTIISGVGEPQSYGSTEGVTPIPFQSYMTGQDSSSIQAPQCVASNVPMDGQPLEGNYQGEEKLISP